VGVVGSRSAAHGSVVRSECSTHSCDWIVATSRAWRTACGAAGVVAAAAEVEAEVEVEVEAACEWDEVYCRAPCERNAASNASCASPPSGVDAAVGTALGSESGEPTWRVISLWNAVGTPQRLLALVGATPGAAEAGAVLAAAATADAELAWAVALMVVLCAAWGLDLLLTEAAVAVEVATDPALTTRLLSLRMRRACARMASMASTGLSSASSATTLDCALLWLPPAAPAIFVPSGPRLRVSGCLSSSALHALPTSTSER
jgi:hypothetical protein